MSSSKAIRDSSIAKIDSNRCARAIKKARDYTKTSIKKCNVGVPAIMRTGRLTR